MHQSANRGMTGASFMLSKLLTFGPALFFLTPIFPQYVIFLFLPTIAEISMLHNFGG